VQQYWTNAHDYKRIPPDSNPIAAAQIVIGGLNSNCRWCTRTTAIINRQAVPQKRRNHCFSSVTYTTFFLHLHLQERISLNKKILQDQFPSSNWGFKVPQSPYPSYCRIRGPQLFKLALNPNRKEYQHFIHYRLDLDLSNFYFFSRQRPVFSILKTTHKKVHKIRHSHQPDWPKTKSTNKLKNRTPTYHLNTAISKRKVRFFDYLEGNLQLPWPETTQTRMN